MDEPLTIAIDAMGGDHAPDAVIGGVEHVLKENSGVRFILFGPQDRLNPLVQTGSTTAPNIEIVHTEDFVAMDAKPTQALRKREKTSMWHAIKAVKDGSADAIVSAGNTGALMAMSYFCLGTADGISRPAISALWP
ncbi:MAG: phosphate acyltransferase, partial [Oricola sp.]|nr:phosphate acyltransferase [Oricola sp.]